MFWIACWPAACSSQSLIAWSTARCIKCAVRKVALYRCVGLHSLLLAAMRTAATLFVAFSCFCVSCGLLVRDDGGPLLTPNVSAGTSAGGMVHRRFLDTGVAAGFPNSKDNVSEVALAGRMEHRLVVAGDVVDGLQALAAIADNTADASAIGFTSMLVRRIAQRREASDEAWTSVTRQVEEHMRQIDMSIKTAAAGLQTPVEELTAGAIACLLAGSEVSIIKGFEATARLNWSTMNDSLEPWVQARDSQAKWCTPHKYEGFCQVRDLTGSLISELDSHVSTVNTTYTEWNTSCERSNVALGNLTDAVRDSAKKFEQGVCDWHARVVNGCTTESACLSEHAGPYAQAKKTARREYERLDVRYRGVQKILCLLHVINHTVAENLGDVSRRCGDGVAYDKLGVISLPRFPQPSIECRIYFHGRRVFDILQLADPVTVAAERLTKFKKIKEDICDLPSTTLTDNHVYFYELDVRYHSFRGQFRGNPDYKVSIDGFVGVKQIYTATAGALDLNDHKDCLEWCVFKYNLTRIMVRPGRWACRCLEVVSDNRWQGYGLLFLRPENPGGMFYVDRDLKTSAECPAIGPESHLSDLLAKVPEILMIKIFYVANHLWLCKVRKKKNTNTGSYLYEGGLDERSRKIKFVKIQEPSGEMVGWGKYGDIQGHKSYGPQDILWLVNGNVLYCGVWYRKPIINRKNQIECRHTARSVSKDEYIYPRRGGFDYETLISGNKIFTKRIPDGKQMYWKLGKRNDYMNGVTDQGADFKFEWLDTLPAQAGR